MKVSLIAAIAENGVIGKGNKLPWSIKSELAHFRQVTGCKPVIMGRKTFESFKTPLKDRPNIVVTRDASYEAAGAIVITSFEKALETGRKIAKETGQHEVVVIGGAEIYKLALPLADRLYLTEVHLKPEGDTKFPAFDRKGWIETAREFHQAQPGETADYTVTVLDRRI